MKDGKEKISLSRPCLNVSEQRLTTDDLHAKKDERSAAQEANKRITYVIRTRTERDQYREEESRQPGETEQTGRSFWVTHDWTDCEG